MSGPKAAARQEPGAHFIKLMRIIFGCSVVFDLTPAVCRLASLKLRIFLDLKKSFTLRAEVAPSSVTVLCICLCFWSKMLPCLRKSWFSEQATLVLSNTL